MSRFLSVGLGGSIHDFATVVADETMILWGLEDERITRHRHAIGSTDPLRPSFEVARASFSEIQAKEAKIVANDVLRDIPLVSEIGAELINHHLSHAYSVFFTSRFEKSAILVIDGAGSVSAASETSHLREATTVYLGDGNNVRTLGSVSGTKLSPRDVNAFDFPASDSLGGFYEQATVCCGYSPCQEGKTMALASYGDDRFVRSFLARLDFPGGLTYTIDFHGPNGFRNLFDSLNDEYGVGDLMPFDVRAAIARAAQELVEVVLSHILRWTYDQTQCENLCVAGGVALNATVMGKLGRISPFRQFSVVSCPGDSGTAVGAAIYGQLASQPGSAARRWHMTPYLGPTHDLPCDSEGELECVYEFSTLKSGARYVFDLLERGEIVACFRGRSEFGPRALGNRSILAHPGVPGITARMNEVKSREWFRPVSPAAILSDRDGYDQGERLMQYARPGANLDFSDRSCWHVDGSARVQAVTCESHDFLWELLQNFNGTGASAVLNTSFNIAGEPIVETRADAVSTFQRSSIDALLIEDKIYRKAAV